MGGNCFLAVCFVRARLKHNKIIVIRKCPSILVLEMVKNKQQLLEFVVNKWTKTTEIALFYAEFSMILWTNVMKHMIICMGLTTSVPIAVISISQSIHGYFYKLRSLVKVSMDTFTSS